MKEYVVEVRGYHICKKYIVSAKDAKDAINQVYEEISEWVYKEDIHAKSIASLHNKEGKFIKVY